MADDETDKVADRPVLVYADGRRVAADPGLCLWCGRWVETGRRMSGATNPMDPAWQDEGDFGCDLSPMTNEEGTGGHSRPWDLALAILAENGKVPT